jgi:hypothetical protein
MELIGVIILVAAVLYFWGSRSTENECLMLKKYKEREKQ